MLRTIASFAAALLLSVNTAFADFSKEVDVELVLAVDISQSMDEEEQEVQRNGYADAIMSPEVLKAIEMGMLGKIAITYIEWGDQDKQFDVTGWHVISNAAEAKIFADKIRSAPNRKVQRTSISSALLYSAAQILENEYEGLRKVIDISGDGPNNQGGLVGPARQTVLDNGITINGLPLMVKKIMPHYPGFELDKYYKECVIGGPGSFYHPVLSLTDFPRAIKTKLVLEMVGFEPPRPTFTLAYVDQVVARRQACNIYQ